MTYERPAHRLVELCRELLELLAHADADATNFTEEDLAVLAAAARELHAFVQLEGHSA